MELREATPDDAAAITTIYNHYITETTISFEEVPVTALDMRERIAAVCDGGLPWLVAVDKGRVIGYAYATRWRVRHAYRFSVESSVYVAHDVRGSGAGSALYRALIDRLRTAQVHLVIGGIAQPNPASVALHEKMGYVQAAMFHEVGYKFGRWIDVGYWELRLDRPQ